MSAKKVVKVLKSKKRFLITSHINLEGDALGSELAIARLLRKMGKTVTVVNADKAMDNYLFLPDIHKIKGPKVKVDFDIALVVDCSDLNRTGKVKDIIRERPIINIDHHISNERFGWINWVDKNSSSACEMIYQLYKLCNVKIDRPAALLLYTGVMTDTGSFRYPNTSASTHEVAARLLKYRLPANDIYRRIYQSNGYADIKLLSATLDTLSIDQTGKVAYFTIDKQMLEGRQEGADQTENILNFGRSIKGVEVAVLFKETNKNGLIRVNLRSHGKFDVNKLATYFGGGGHRTASGCSIRGSLGHARMLVLNKIKQML